MINKDFCFPSHGTFPLPSGEGPTSFCLDDYLNKRKGGKYKPGYLSDYFSLDEMLKSEIAAREGIINLPDKSQLKSMEFLCRNGLDPVRRGINKSVHVTSGLRVQALNYFIKKANTPEKKAKADRGQHPKGEAADIQVYTMSSRELWSWIIKARIAFDQLIDEFGSWVHFAVSEKGGAGVITIASLVDGEAEYKHLSRKQAEEFLV